MDHGHVTPEVRLSDYLPSALRGTASGLMLYPGCVSPKQVVMLIMRYCCCVMVLVGQTWGCSLSAVHCQ